MCFNAKKHMNFFLSSSLRSTYAAQRTHASSDPARAVAMSKRSDVFSDARTHAFSDAAQHAARSVADPAPVASPPPLL